jgi:hypothetical protein
MSPRTGSGNREFAGDPILAGRKSDHVRFDALAQAIEGALLERRVVRGQRRLDEAKDPIRSRGEKTRSVQQGDVDSWNSAIERIDLTAP